MSNLYMYTYMQIEFCSRFVPRQVFDDPEMFRKMESQAVKFQELHVHMVEYMSSVTGDPRVVSMLNKQRGDRGWRLHQGDKLRDLLTQWIATEVSARDLLTQWIATGIFYLYTRYLQCVTGNKTPRRR